MKVVVITGPTGVGKSKISISIAKAINGEIINADSRQVYKGMDIVTAKEIDSQISHHLFSFKDWHEEYSVYDYQRDCRMKIAEISQRGKVPILVGGTGLYIKAALYDYQFQTGIKKDYSNFSNEELHQKLQKIDPDNAIHKNNRPRLEQALNYFEQTKKPFSQKPKNNKLLYDVVWIGLTMPREKLYHRINQRVDNMITNGLIEEAYDIYKKGAINNIVLTPIGYKELFAYFDKKQSLDVAVAAIKKQTRNYAKRQYTWFNNQLPLKWFMVGEEDVVKKIIAHLEVKNIK